MAWDKRWFPSSTTSIFLARQRPPVPRLLLALNSPRFCINNKYGDDERCKGIFSEFFYQHKLLDVHSEK